MNIDINALKDIAVKAGDEILKIYHDKALSGEVDYKSDNSPLTLADQASNEVIVNALKSLYPDIPVLSEEEKHTEYEIRKHWNRFWLVDPLDGTKEFIKRNGEFTVNIALIEDRYPVLGIIYTPVLKKLYIGNVLEGAAIMITDDKKEHSLKVNSRQTDRIAVGSRSHKSDEEAELLEQYGVIETISVGSSLKFCMVAEGKADIYYRHGPTMEWDTAAGQAIAEAAGAKVLSMTTNERFVYNKENLLNSSFLVLGF